MRTKTEAHRDLLTLRNFLLDLPHSKFHMPDFCSDNATATSCGTAGCIAGWAATRFSQKGWTITDWSHLPEYKGELGQFAFAMFFQISIDDASNLTCEWDWYWKHYRVRADDITPAIAADALTKIGMKYAPELFAEEAVPAQVEEPVCRA